jgi:hypothetical protein
MVRSRGRDVLAMTRYELALLGHSQRYVPAVVAFLAVLAIQYTDQASPVLPEFAVSSAALLVVGCWLTIALLDVEDPAQRLVTLSHARGWRPMLTGVVLAVLACAVALTAASEIWSVVVHRHAATAQLGIGALAHLAGASLGIAIGLPCSRLLVNRVGWTVIAAVPALAAVLLVRWIPLANPMLSAMASGRPATGAVLFGALASAVALAFSAGTVGFLVRRRS